MRWFLIFAVFALVACSDGAGDNGKVHAQAVDWFFAVARQADGNTHLVAIDRARGDVVIVKGFGLRDDLLRVWFDNASQTAYWISGENLYYYEVETRESGSTRLYRPEGLSVEYVIGRN